MKSRNGFALTELIVVMVIIGILTTIGTIGFNEWNRKSQIERQARELAADLNMARTESIYTKKRHAIIINSDAKGYVLRRYSSENEDRTSTAPASAIVSSKTVSYQFSKVNGNSIADSIFQFDITGFTATAGDNDSIRINPTNSGAFFDCVVVSVSRINMGQVSGGSCVQK